MHNPDQPFSPIKTIQASPTPINLGYWMCYLLDSKSNTNGAISYNSMDNSTTFRCPFTSKYLAGSAGPSVSLCLFIIISIISVFGLVFNVINISVLRKIPKKDSSLNRLLIILAVFDLLASGFALLTAAFLQVIKDDVSRSAVTLIIFRVSFLLYSFGRTGSVFITILITIERYVIVTSSFKPKAWLTPCRSVTILVIFFLVIILINIPWWLSSVLEPNSVGKWDKGNELSKYPYLYVMTTFGERVYFRWLRPIHVFVDFVLPLPVLLLFNGLLYKFIRKWSKERGLVLTGSHHHEGEINATKMLACIVLILLFCHSFSIINFIISEVLGVLYREIQLFIILTVTLNAFCNFFVYYIFSQDFRDSLWRKNPQHLRNSRSIRSRDSVKMKALNRFTY